MASVAPVASTVSYLPLPYSSSCCVGYFSNLRDKLYILTNTYLPDFSKDYDCKYTYESHILLLVLRFCFVEDYGLFISRYYARPESLWTLFTVYQVFPFKGIFE